MKYGLLRVLYKCVPYMNMYNITGGCCERNIIICLYMVLQTLKINFIFENFVFG